MGCALVWLRIAQVGRATARLWRAPGPAALAAACCRERCRARHKCIPCPQLQVECRTACRMQVQPCGAARGVTRITSL